MKGILLLAIMVILIPMAFFAPFTGILTYLWIGIFRPHEWAYTPGAAYSLIIGSATLLGYFIFELGRRPPKILPNLWMLLLWGQLSLSTIFAFSTDNTLPKYIEFSKIIVIGMLISALVDSESKARWLLMVLLGSVGLVALRSFLSIAIHLGRAPIAGPGGKFEDNNDYALLLNMSIPVLYYFSRSEEKWWIRWAGYTVAAMMAVTVLYTRSRGGFLGLCVIALFLVFKSNHKIIGSVLAAAAMITMLAFAPEDIINRLKTLQEVKEGEIKDPSALQRKRAWNESMQIIGDYPGLGVGMNNMLLVLPRYGNENENEQRIAHNSWLQVAVDAGLPALFFFVVMLIVSIRRLRLIRRLLMRSPTEKRIINYAHGMEIAFVTFCVSGTFLSQYWQELLYVYVPLTGNLLILARQAEQEVRNREIVEKSIHKIDGRMVQETAA
ncbi:MAG TPA: putative O-glycosylation ligase, exosortase A system-associated [Blastocatellia bacterium]|nr:putative O-glycosylation ligase, exosortase A system-associated [Blastocatellia bacterium]